MTSKGATRPIVCVYIYQLTVAAVGTEPVMPMMAVMVKSKTVSAVVAEGVSWREHPMMIDMVETLLIPHNSRMVMMLRATTTLVARF
jgi:hypothetical protein